MPPGLLGWAQPTTAGLLAIFVILTAIGWLVPAKTLRRELAAKDKHIEVLRETVEALQARGDLLAELQRELIPYARNVDTLITELRRRTDAETT